MRMSTVRRRTMKNGGGWPRLCLLASFLLFQIGTQPTVVWAQRFNCSTSAGNGCVYRPLFRVQAIVHGEKSDLLWQQIEAAAVQAGRDMNVDFSMQLHDTYDDTMASDILVAASGAPPPDALIVTIPDNVVQQAVGTVLQEKQIPVFGLNVGADVGTVPTKGFVALDDYSAGRAAGDTFRRLLLGNETNVTSTTAWTGLYVNHDFGSLAQENQKLGLHETLDEVVEMEELGFFPEEWDQIRGQLQQQLSGCPYRIIQLSSIVLLEPTRAAMASNDCRFNDTLVGVTGYNSDPLSAYRGIANGEVAFVISEQPHVEGSLAVVMASLFATTGKKLADPGDAYGSGAYLSGPKVITKDNLPSPQQQACEVQGYPVCHANSNITDADASCPCFDRSKVVLAGVTHGITSSFFWDEVYAASAQAAKDFGIQLKMPRIEPQDNDTVVHEIMAEQIVSFCEDGVDGIFVSLPSDLVLEAVKRCQELRVPIMSINSGADYAEELGLLGHIGQLEFRGGKSAGQKLIDAGVTRGVCVYQEESNVGLFERCSGMEQAFNESGFEYLGAVYASPEESAEAHKAKVEPLVGESGSWNGVGLLAGGVNVLPQALEIQKDHPDLKLGAFDLNTVLYDALKEKSVMFGIDQNSYLQGYLPIPFLTWYAQTGQILVNQFIESGPDFIEEAPSEAAVVCQSTYFDACDGATKPPVVQETSTGVTLLPFTRNLVSILPVICTVILSGIR